MITANTMFLTDTELSSLKRECKKTNNYTFIKINNNIYFFPSMCKSHSETFDSAEKAFNFTWGIKRTNGVPSATPIIASSIKQL